LGDDLLDRPSRPTVGAIRWDGWFGPTGTVGKAVHAIAVMLAPVTPRLP
jgi:hypothetical protein